MATALLVIDVQRALCTGDEAAYAIDEVIGRINGLSRAARAATVPVVLVQHEEAGSPLSHGSQGWQLDARVEVAPADLRVRKTSPDSFYETALDTLLRERQVTRLVLCGLQTEFCIDTTVRRALSLGYDVVLASDAHSTSQSDTLSAAQIVAHHNRTLRWLGGFAASIVVAPAQEVRVAG